MTEADATIMIVGDPTALPNEEIEYFQRERRPDRFFPSGEPKPQHPIVIEGSTLGGRYE